MKYIALLKRINISGKNKISMNELKLELENNKYKNVLNFICPNGSKDEIMKSRILLGTLKFTK